METKQFEKLVLTCTFENFAQAYTGFRDTESIFNIIEHENQMSFVDPQSKGEFLCDCDLIALWDSYVEVRIIEQLENGNYVLNLTVSILPGDSAFKAYNGSVIECDCVDAKRLFKDIISFSF